jgi:gliding motility-associated-like protein
MKRLRFFVLFVGLLLSGAQELRAQIDTTFWFAAPWVTPDHWWRDPMAFHFSTFNNPTIINMKMPASTFDTTFTVPANTLFTKYVTHLMNAIESKPANTVLNTGIQITSNFPITVVYDIITRSPQFYNPETYSLKGQNGMGYEFVCPFQISWNNQTLGGDLNGDGTVTQPKQQIQVVATEDNTTIWITPKCNVVGHPANITYAVVLPLAGNVYTVENVVQNTSVPGNNLAGSIVVSDKPVSVVVSDDSVNPAGGGGCHDLMGDQIVPTDVIGNDYIINRGFLNAGSDEAFYVLATENFTTVTITDGGTTTIILNQGDSYEYEISNQLTYCTADKPVYLLHMSGYGCELGEALLPPLNCAGSDQISFARANGQSFLLNIVCPAGTEDDFTLNGSTTLVPAGAFAPVPGTGGAWMGAQISYNTTDVPVGSANLITNSSDYFSLGIINGGASTGCLYHYMSLFVRKVFVDAGNDTTMCSTASTIVDLNGSVSGGATTGIWSVLDGSGAFGNPTDLGTDYTPTSSDFAQGSVTFVLQSTGNCLPEYDTVKVTFIESPQVTAGLDQFYCRNNVPDIPLNGTLQYAVASTWSGGVGGAFDDISDLNTFYTASPADIAEDSLLIFITSSGSFFACPDDEDTVTIYFTDPPNVVAGPDIVTCASQPSAPLNGVVTGASLTGVWTTSGSGSFNPSQTDLLTDYLISGADTTAGSVTLVLTSTNNGGCLAVSDSLMVTILDQPAVQITSADSICANLPTISLTGTVTSGYSTIWSATGFGSIANPNMLNTIYTVNTADTIIGYVDVFLETSGGICPIEEDSLRIYFIAPPTANAGLDQAYCENEMVPLNGILGGSASSGSWTSTGTGTFDPSSALLTTFYQPSPLDLSTGYVDLILTTSADFGCLADKDTVQITYKDAPVADYDFGSACFGDNTDFFDQSTVSSGAIINWTWDFDDGTGGSIANNPIHPFPASGCFNPSLIVESSNNCFDTIAKQVCVNPLPLAIFNNTYACQGESVDFQDLSFLASGTIASWDWDFNNGEGTSTQQDPSYTFTVPGLTPVMLTVTSDSGCVASVTNNVDVLTGPDAAFSVAPIPALVLENITYTDQTIGSITNWYWDFGDGIGGNNQNEVHQYANGGVYTVVLEVTDTAGCMDTTSAQIQIVLLPVLPSGFTPNGDGDNDVFIIRGGPFEATDFRIYNNWGQLVFSTDNSLIGWDGTYNGQDAPVGVYTWVFTVTITGGRQFIKEGDVTLIR